MPADDGLLLEANDISDPTPAPLKFKVVTPDGYSATTTLDEKWQAKPFLTAVIKPVVLKLNKRADKEPVAAELLEKVEIDGEETADYLDFSKATVSSLVKPNTSQVCLTFGIAPPKELKFAVRMAASTENVFTITLDSKFMKKSFHDAVIVPFVHYYNKRVHLPVEPAQCVQVLVDGQKITGSQGAAVHKKTAFQLLGRAPATVELFFSWEAVSHHEKVASGRAKKNEGYSRLEFKIPVANSANVISEKVLNYSHSELNEADGIALGKKLLEYGGMHTGLEKGLAKLKHLYLEHNRIGDGGAASVAKALNRSTTPNLRRIVMRNNRIGVQGCIGMAAAWGCAAVEASPGDGNDGGGDGGAADAAVADGTTTAITARDKKSRQVGDSVRSPALDLLSLEENWINSEGALALGRAFKAGALTVREVRLYGNNAITPGARESLKQPEYVQQGLGVKFVFDDTTTGSCMTQEGEVIGEIPSALGPGGGMFPSK
jgi:hypothetical protein